MSHPGAAHSERSVSCKAVSCGLLSTGRLTYFRRPPNVTTESCRNRKCTECGTATFGRNRMFTESAILSTFGAETETEIRSSSTCMKVQLTDIVIAMAKLSLIIIV